MLLEYTVETLNELLKFKLAEEELKPKIYLLNLVLSGQRNIDIDGLERLIYEDKKSKPNEKTERIKILKEAINRNFEYCRYDQLNNIVDKIEFITFQPSKVVDTNTSDIWIIQLKEEHMASETIQITKRRTKIISEHRKVMIKQDNLNTQQDSNISIETSVETSRTNPKKTKKLPNPTLPKKSILNLPKKDSLLNFITVHQKKHRNEISNLKFIPISRPENVIKDTVRLRDDIVRPVKMTYIKLVERIRPSIYQPSKEKYNFKDSTRKLPIGVDYEFDSDLEWEDCEEGEDIGSDEESEESVESDASDFIESDSISDDKKYHVPELVYPNLTFEIFYEYEKNLNVPLFQLTTLSSEVRNILGKEYVGQENNIEFISEFSRRHNITIKALQKAISDLNSSSGIIKEI